MNLDIAVLDGVTVSGRLKLVPSGTKTGLYMAESGPVADPQKTLYDYQTLLKAVPATGLETLAPASISLDQPLPGEGAWDLALTGEGKGQVAFTQFGGGWNTLVVDGLDESGQETLYHYDVEETDTPRFIVNTGETQSAEQFVSAIFSGNQLGLIGLQEQDGQKVPHVSGIVGSSDKPVSKGRVFGDFSAGVPASFNVVYLEAKNVGPLAPDGSFSGALYLAPYDTKKNKLGQPVRLLPDLEFCDFDLAVSRDFLCVFGVTGDGLPLLALFDHAGNQAGAANVPAGSWNSMDRWIASPTTVATAQEGDNPPETVFRLAFIEVAAGVPTSAYTGTLSVPVISP